MGSGKVARESARLLLLVYIFCHIQDVVAQGSDPSSAADKREPKWRAHVVDITTCEHTGGKPRLHTINTTLYLLRATHNYREATLTRDSTALNYLG